MAHVRIGFSLCLSFGHFMSVGFDWQMARVLLILIHDGIWVSLDFVPVLPYSSGLFNMDHFYNSTFGPSTKGFVYWPSRKWPLNFSFLLLAKKIEEIVQNTLWLICTGRVVVEREGTESS